MGPRPLTDQERGRIHGFRETGLDYRTIAARVKRSVSVVGRVLSSKKPAPPKPLGRPTKLSDRLVRHVIRRGSEGGTSSTKPKAEFELPCAALTVRRILADTRLPGVRQDGDARLDAGPQGKALGLGETPPGDGPRLEGCRLLRREEVEPRKARRLQFSWKDARRPPKKYAKHQQGRGSIMFWGVFSSMNVEVLDWPARSPDVTPIENICAIMARRVYGDGKQYDNMAELRQAVLDAWDSITLDEICGFMTAYPYRAGASRSCSAKATRPNTDHPVQ